MSAVQHPEDSDTPVSLAAFMKSASRPGGVSSRRLANMGLVAPDIVYLRLDLISRLGAIKLMDGALHIPSTIVDHGSWILGLAWILRGEPQTSPHGASNASSGAGIV